MYLCPLPGNFSFFLGVKLARTKNIPKFAPRNAKIAQLVEHNLAKVRVAGSSPVFRSLYKLPKTKASQTVGREAFSIECL